MKFILSFFITLSFTLKSQAFSVETLNLWHWPNDYSKRKSNLLKRIDSNVSDIHVFQEAWQTIRKKGLFRDFIEFSKYDYTLKKTNNLFFIKEGMAAASKFPLLKEALKSIILPGSTKTRTRLMLIAPYLIEGRKVYIFNLHLSPFPSGKQKRIEQLNFIASLIKTHYSEKIVLLMGDFNQEYDKEIFDPITKLGFKKSLKAKCSFCFGDNPYVKEDHTGMLDYIFYRPSQLNLIKSNLSFKKYPVSDHYGIFAEFKFIGDK